MWTLLACRDISELRSFFSCNFLIFRLRILAKLFDLFSFVFKLILVIDAGDRFFCSFNHFLISPILLLDFFLGHLGVFGTQYVLLSCLISNFIGFLNWVLNHNSITTMFCPFRYEWRSGRSIITFNLLLIFWVFNRKLYSFSFDWLSSLFGLFNLGGG